MSWNFRIVQIETGDQEEPHYYSMREVYYNDDGSIYAISTTDFPVGGADPVDIEWMATRFLEACKKPILTQSDINFDIA